MAKLTKSPKLNQLLYNMNIHNEYDVVNHLPRRYEDFSLTPIKNIEDKKRIVVEGRVISIPLKNESKRVVVVSFDINDINNRFYRIIAFNRPYLTKIVNINETYIISGIYKRDRNEIDLINIVKKSDSNDLLKPIYSLPSEFPNHSYSMLVKRSLLSIKDSIYSNVPYQYINKYKLVKKDQALELAHFPKTNNDIKEAYRYLKYEEALMFSLKNILIRQSNKSLSKIRKEPIGIESCFAFINRLPYKLSNSQMIASTEIINDMNDSTLMYRMLQGDVGSGKTVVSFIALFANYIRGDQGAIMCPTDALARQHYKNAIQLFDGLKINIALLTGSTSIKEKEEIYQRLEDQDIDIVIGTHALFSNRVKYNSLGLVVIDEQHRFGVDQRLKLAKKGDNADLLMMSATPIPRSLALTLYGDLEISTIDEYPFKKQSPKTIIMPSSSLRINKAIEYALFNNKKVYIIAPSINEGIRDLHSVEEIYKHYFSIFGNKVGLLHGKMNNELKIKALQDFESGITPILVSTLVVEVGIDVKDASLMIIYDANNFGLASLHQLRGRVGRDGGESFCILTHDDEEGMERLSILVNSSDGFFIAENDLKLRGPGDLSGLRQSGLPDFKFLNVIDDIKIFQTAKKDAVDISLDEEGKFKHLLEYLTRQIKLLDIKKG